MKNINDIILQGRIGKEPETRYTKNNSPVVNFSIAVSKGKDRDPMWINVVSYDEKVVSDINKYFHKGYSIVVHGSLDSNKWTDKNGMEHTDIQIVASNLSFFGNSKREEQEQENNSGYSDSYSPNTGKGFKELDTADEGLPF